MHIGLIGGIGPAATDFYHRGLIARHRASGIPLELTIAYAEVLDMSRNLTEGRPDRIILFDSPPLLAASPAAVLAGHAAIALLVVRADRTTESALRDAAGLLKGASQVKLLLNGVNFASGGRRFGSYHAYGHDAEHGGS